MNAQERKVYGKEYRQAGFGRQADRKYYSIHREDILKRKKARYQLSQQMAKPIANCICS